MATCTLVVRETRKPFAVTVSVYDPAGTSVNAYVPSSVVTAARDWPVELSIMLIAAFGTAAPLASSTVPTIEPYRTCASAGRLKQAAAASTRRHITILRIGVPT